MNEREEIVKDWLLSALSDLKNIEYILEDKFLTNVVAFHAQQCVEKCLKAILEYKGLQVPRTHKLQSLIDLLTLDLGINEDMLIKLDELYIDSRYPSDFGLLPSGKPTLKDAREFYEFAKDVFDRVCNLLGIKAENFY